MDKGKDSFNRLYVGYFALIALVFPMGVAIWAASLEHLSDIWRFQFIICADIILFVIILGFIYLTEKIVKIK